MRQNDHFGVGFDTFYDRRSGFMFYANPLGGFSDYSVVDEGAPNTDWNPVWDVADRPLRRRLDDRDADPVQVAALHVGHRSGVGHPVPPLDSPQERVDLSDAGAAEHGRSPGAQSRVGRTARWSVSICRRRARNIEIKPYALGKMSTDRLTQSADRRTIATATSAATSSTA